MRGLVVGILIAVAISGCIVRHLVGPRLTGTCDGACSHYVECKPGHLDTDRSRCTAECPSVFSDADSLRMYESLSCKDAVEFVDGTNPKAATSK